MHENTDHKKSEYGHSSRSVPLGIALQNLVASDISENLQCTFLIRATNNRGRKHKLRTNKKQPEAEMIKIKNRKLLLFKLKEFVSVAFSEKGRYYKKR